MVAVTKKPFVNPNLISLKCVLFTFFGGLGCIFPFMPGHMRAIGLNREESRLIQIVAPAVSIIGPLIVCFLADRWIAVKKGSRYGSYIRVITGILILLSALFYAFLLLVPKISREVQRRPLVSFACDSDGAYILQEKCLDEKVCHHWKEPKYGNLLLTNCSYTCLNPEHFENKYRPFVERDELSDINPSPQSLSQPEQSTELDYLDDEPDKSEESYRTKRQSSTPVSPPHICITRENKPELCHAYVIGTKVMKVQATVNSAVNEEANDTISADWCWYPIDGYTCAIPNTQKHIQMKANGDCKPTVACDVFDPYDSQGSALADALCIKVSS